MVERGGLMIAIGVVGCGKISRQYLENLTGMFKGVAQVVSCADLDLDVARATASEFGIPKAYKPDDLYKDREVSVVLNLTNPWAHAEVNTAALEAGKHVYAEKPLALDREAAQQVMQLARKQNLRVGCAPDTFLGAGLQTCRKLIDEGWIGEPSVVRGVITMHGARLLGRYQTKRVGGVLLDMGPYYITAMVALFGSVQRLAAVARSAERAGVIADPNASNYGESVSIETPVTVSGTLDFANGMVGQLTTTTRADRYGPSLEVIGTEGTLICNDPNMFGGPVLLRRGNEELREVAHTHPYVNRNRGLGLLEMIKSAEAGLPHRASDELAYHVLDIMLSLTESSESGKFAGLDSSVERPRPMPFGRHTDPFGT